MLRVLGPTLSVSLQGALIKEGYNLSLSLGVVPKAKTLVSKLAGPQETNGNCRFVTFVWMSKPLCQEQSSIWGRGGEQIPLQAGQENQE